jgi:demethylmenaquinone methyltransferase/2-methoxy-6-polyprenyl-1,4-benzoquinol methylase
MNSTKAIERPPGGNGEMFDGIADRYDLLNRIISLGIDQSWRKKTVDSLKLDAACHALDLATGTADLALMTARRVPGCRVTGVDPSVKMLEVGERKVERAGLGEQVRLKVGDAQALPFADDTFDGAMIAFGIRNVPDRRLGLSEMGRVTRAGGKIAILELSEPRGGLMGPLARFHVHTVVPWLGGLLSGKKEYRYLQKSIAAFPPAEEFAQVMQDAGLSVELVLPLTFGVAHLYVATPNKTG